MIPLSKLEVTKCHVKKAAAGENGHPIKFDHLLHPDHEINRLTGTQNPSRSVHFKVTDDNRACACPLA